MLKKSMYNIELEQVDNGDVLLFNTLSGAFGIMSKHINEEYYVDDYIDEKSLQPEDSKDINIMKDNGFLINIDIDEYKLISTLGNIQRFNSDSLALTIAPTLDCNMACPYCYEKKVKKSMDENTKEKLVEFINKNIESKKIKNLQVTWYGGEPLLEINTIEELSEKFIKICEENNINYYAGIITNGSLLDYKNACILKEKCKVTFAQITIDGMKETHNKRRILKNGGDSFSLIVNNITRAHELFHISIRVNVDKSNIDESLELVDYLSKLLEHTKNVDCYLAPVTKQTDSCKADPNMCFTMKEFGEIDSQIIKKLYENGYENNGQGITKLEFPYSSPLGCRALGTNYYVIDPDGYLYKCWDEVGIKDQNVGDIVNGSIINKHALDWLSLDIPEKCKTCNMLPLCQGGCPFQRLRNGNQQICHYRTVSFQEELKVYYHSYKNHKEQVSA